MVGLVVVVATCAPEFHRDLYTEFGRDGLIVDLQDAEGGNASVLVAEKLARRSIG